MSSRARLLRLLSGAAAVLCAGLAYALWVRATHLALPCPFRAVTGLLCPGCGVTTLCMALLRLDFRAAWAANPALLLCLPVLALLGARCAARYVREGSGALRGWESGLCWALAAALLLWGAARNLFRL